MKKNIFWPVFLLGLFFCFASFGQGLSELNLQTFEKKSVTQPGSEAVKNPFSAGRTSPKDMILEDLFLNGVVIGGSENYALVSGHVLKVGDSIAGLRVRSIDSGKVVLQELDQIYTLYFDGGM